MADRKGKESLVEKRDLIHIAILAAIALVIGVYLIVTTVLISRDGVGYIERAQQLASDPIKIMKVYPPGYPFLILMAHKFTALFTDDSSVFTWIYSAQAVTLLCRLLALIPLYFIGKLLVGGKNSFWALLILIFLPFSARSACDVVREWPYLLFLATGFFFLLWSAKSGKWWLFGFVGLSCGLGYLIRPESAQLVVYGLLWVVLSMFRPKLWGVYRWKILAALALLLIGFAIPAVPYMKCTGKIIPLRVKHIMKSFSFNTLPDKTDEPKVNTVSSNYNTAEIVPPDVLEAFSEIFKTIGENLMWFFMPALMIGLYYHFRNNAKFEELFLITAFMMMNIAMMVVRYCYIQLHVSQRWSLPLVTFTIFYVPVGLKVVGDWLNNKPFSSKQKTDIPGEKRLSWFIILFLIGTGVCMPKLFRPVRIEKQGYKEAVNWLMENTVPTDIIAASDSRIAFYAERASKKIQMDSNTVSGKKVTLGNWHHLTGTYDGSHQKLYIDGKLVSSTNPGLGLLNAGSNDLAIGKPTAESRSCFKGVIDEVRLYNAALSEKNVETLYNKLPPQIEKSALIGYWSMDSDVPGISGRPKGAMAFNGTTDCIDLSHLGSKLNVDNLSVSLWIRPELLGGGRMNWIIGNKAQFHFGFRNSTIYFWIQERRPGCIIPAETSYVIKLTNEKTSELSEKFNKKVQEKYSGWVNERKKKKRIVIYEVL